MKAPGGCRSMVARRGQSLVLLALTLLLLTLMVLMTISIGVTAARRADLNDAADAAAYSSAVATARTFNTAAVLNRAIIAHYVTMAGVQAQLAYGSSGAAYFDLAATQFRMFDMVGPYPISTGDGFLLIKGPLGCDQRTWEVRDASYDMWHASLAWSARGSPPDEVNGACVHGNCTAYRDWIAESLGSLEHHASREARDVHDAIWDLASVERDTYLELHGTLASGQLARDVATRAGVAGNLQVNGRQALRDELEGSTNSNPSGSGGPQRASFQRPFADAVMGSRHEHRLELPDTPENLPPLVRDLKAQTDAEFARYPGRPFTATFNAGDTSADVPFQDTFDELMTEGPRVVDPMSTGQAAATNVVLPYVRYAFGRVQRGNVITTYNDSCAGGTRTIVSNPASDKDRVVPDAVISGVSYRALPFGVVVRSSLGVGLHTSYESGYTAGAHWPLYGGGCHGTHEHYGWEPVDMHRLNHHTLPLELLGFVLPDPDQGEKGAGGVWGQPVLPVVLSRRFDGSRDPWNLKFNFQFDRSQNGTTFDMQQLDEVHAVSSGIAYYHRREHLGEPPNLLNPFWRATLVPLEIDERGAQQVRGQVADPTYASERPGNRLDRVLVNELTGYPDRSDAKQAYDALKNRVDGMRKIPQPEAP